MTFSRNKIEHICKPPNLKKKKLGKKENIWLRCKAISTTKVNDKNTETMSINNALVSFLLTLNRYLPKGKLLSALCRFY